jgi:hypothetical protein
MVDTAQNEIGPLRHERFDGQHYAVCRRAVNLKSSLAALDWADGMVKR